MAGGDAIPKKAWPGGATGPTDSIWTPDDVRQRLEDVGRTLVALPMPRGALPRDARSNWPDVARGYEDAFAALIGATDEVKQDFSDVHNRVHVTPSALAVGRMDEVLAWLWRIDDPRKRRLCLSRALVHPVSGRHMVSYRKLARIFGLHHETVRAWHDRALAEIATQLTEERVSKEPRRPGRRNSRTGRI